VDERAELEAHLADCPECRQLGDSWRFVRTKLADPIHAKPPAGFAVRFQGRLADARARRAKRQTALILFGSLTGMIALAALLVPLVLQGLAAGATRLLTDLLSIDLHITLVRDVFDSFLSLLPGPVSMLARISLAVAALGLAWAIYASMGAMWAAAVYQFAITKNGGTR
jgi:predicted anti-sigma-YlaC factor YlaD